jgi:flagellar FliL protein
VLFALAATFILTLATTAIRSGKVALPEYQIGAAPANYSLAQEFIVDLAPDAAGRTGFLKLRMTISASSKTALSEVEENGAQIRERVSFFLRELTGEDFAGTEAAERVKAELLKRARLPVSENAIKDVVIDELVIQ